MRGKKLLSVINLHPVNLIGHNHTSRHTTQPLLTMKLGLTVNTQYKQPAVVSLLVSKAQMVW